MSAEPSRYRPFSIAVQRSDREVSIAVVGDLDLASADRLEREVAQQCAAGNTRLLIDLGEVDFIDSTGLRVLLALRNDAKRKAHVLTLVPPSPAARRIFTITGTRALFDWEGDRAGRDVPRAQGG
jgi:anti-anti-sigma factor